MRIFVAIILTGFVRGCCAGTSPAPMTRPVAARLPSGANGVRPVDAPEPLNVRVVVAWGNDQYRAAGDIGWKPLLAERKLVEGAEIRVGIHGFVQFTVGDGPLYHMDRLSTAKIERDQLQTDGAVRDSERATLRVR